jgi:adenylate kinase
MSDTKADNKKRIIGFIGAPGSGKSTQGDLLISATGWPDINIGRSLRKSTNANLQALMATGELVPDKFVYEIISAEIQSSSSNTIIFDGFFRHEAELQWLLAQFDSLGIGKIEVIHFDISEETSVNRILARAKIQHRADDQDPEVVANRFSVFNSNFQAVLNSLHQVDGGRVVVHPVSAEGTPEFIHEEILSALQIPNPNPNSKSIK